LDHLVQHIESLIFTAEQPVSQKEIKNCLEATFQAKIPKPHLEKALQTIQEKYQDDSFAFEVVEIADGYQFLTKGAYHNTIGTLLKQKTKKRLSRAALETLAIIAYKQPITKGEMEKIRGVSCDYSVQKLLEKELVAIAGRSEGPGRPLIYTTSEKFMDYFGIKSISELPKIKDFKTADSEIGEGASVEEVVAQAVEDTSTPPVAEEVEEKLEASSETTSLPEEEGEITPLREESEEKREAGSETTSLPEDEGKNTALPEARSEKREEEGEKRDMEQDNDDETTE